MQIDFCTIPTILFNESTYREQGTLAMVLLVFQGVVYFIFLQVQLT
jgi:hypothetical protein